MTMHSYSHGRLLRSTFLTPRANLTTDTSCSPSVRSYARSRTLSPYRAHYYRLGRPSSAYKITHAFFVFFFPPPLLRSAGISTARIASSKTALRPFCLRVSAGRLCDCVRQTSSACCALDNDDESRVKHAR